MRQVKLGTLIVLFIVAVIPIRVVAQTTDPPPPPPCCSNQDPPPPGGNNAVQTTGSYVLTAQISIAYSTLGALGLTREQFLDREAAALFSGTTQAVYLAIPVAGQVRLPDGTVTTAMFYSYVEMDSVSSLSIDLVDLFYMTCGQTVIKITFVHDVLPSKS